MQLTDLQECYLQKRRHWAKQLQGGGRDLNNINSLGYHAGLRDFQSVLTSCTRYRYAPYLPFEFVALGPHTWFIEMCSKISGELGVAN